MTPRELKIELWLAVILVSTSASILGALSIAVVCHRFPEILIPLANALFGTKENAAVAADLGIKLGIVSAFGLVIGLGCLAHSLLGKRKLSNPAQP